MIVFALFLVFLAIVAITPLLIVAISAYDGSPVEKMDGFLTGYDSLILSIGTLFLISGLALWTTHLSSRSSKAQAIINRKTQVEIKLAEFRQAWINDLRDDMSVLIQFIYSSKDNKSETSKDVILCFARVKLRLNEKEELNKEFLILFSEYMGTATEDDTDLASNLATKIVKVSNQVLKLEWNRLKTDLEHAQIDLEPHQ